MLDIRAVTATFAVAPQIAPEDLAAVTAAGFVAVVNNRPEGEAADQPEGEAIRAAAEAAGLGYTAVPITHAGFSFPQLDAMAAALAAADGPVLAFCRSGTRSCHLWALTQARAGTPPALLADQAAAAGYDLTPLRPLLDQLAGSA